VVEIGEDSSRLKMEKSVDNANYEPVSFTGIWERFWSALLTEDMSP